MFKYERKKEIQMRRKAEKKVVETRKDSNDMKLFMQDTGKEIGKELAVMAVLKVAMKLFGKAAI